MATLSSGRQSPFRRQPSTSSPSPLRASTPSSSPTKSSLLSPVRGAVFSTDTADQRISLHQPGSNRLGSPAALSQEKEHVLTNTTSETRSQSPVRRLQGHIFSSPSPAPDSPLDQASLPASPSTQILLAQDGASRTSSPAAMPIRQPMFANRRAEIRPPQLPKSGGNYNNIPAPLLRSLRESFEVLDPNATGSLNATSLPPVLDQIGLPVDSKTLSAFFPPGQAANMNLASYLDMLCGPVSQLSSQDELSAAFGAFDVDDSGQVDVHELKQALLRTMPEPGETNTGARLSETEIDSVLQNFTGRRAFGSRNTPANKGTPGSRGEVFKWRDFVNSVTGGADNRNETLVA